MLTAARKLLGVRENPPGSNNNVVTRWYGLRGPWCNMAVSYAAAHSDNLAVTGGKFAYAVAHARYFQNRQVEQRGRSAHHDHRHVRRLLPLRLRR
ncbi:hypothetical protein AB0N50_25090 [Streptomyces pharetrae]|jgi:hypothetical protein|uniref:hypothetical protein n=1 Tax=Streptomyces pharetrae TaxID=291370 RepID=UPI00345F29B2